MLASGIVVEPHGSFDIFLLLIILCYRVDNNDKEFTPALKFQSSGLRLCFSERNSNSEYNADCDRCSDSQKDEWNTAASCYGSWGGEAPMMLAT